MTACRQARRRPISREPKEPGQTVLSLQRAFSTLTLTRMPLDHAEFDAGYLARLKTGDMRTEQHFEAYFSNVIWLKLRNRVRARHLIDEIRQETFTRVIKYLKSDKIIQYPERFGAFVLSVCNNVMLEVLRIESQQLRPPGTPGERPDERVRFDADIVTEERKRVVRDVLAEMPAKDSDLLRMVFLEEGDRSAISKHFSVDSDYLRVLLHRAKERFREVVKKKGVAAGLQ
jgi:RNA polymerase sigma-70 factor (ECF subfamily)